MKKLFSVFLAVLVLLGTLPFSAAACEGNLEQNDLIELACEVFPEYEEYLNKRYSMTPFEYLYN